MAVYLSSRHRLIILSMELAISMLFLVSCGLVQAPAPTIALQQIITGLPSPVAITHAGDGSGRLFITLQEGKIIIFEGNQVLPRPFLDISSLIACCGERGLLSVAFHPNYKTRGYFYVDYTEKQRGDTVIARYSVSANPTLADANSELILLTIHQPFPNHNGGQLQFGPDGYLYIGMGDGGEGGYPQNNAQNGQSLLGKLLRIDVNNVNTRDSLPYDIPPNNPFVGDPNVRDEVWALGLRNPWRFSFDRSTGDLFIADVGQNNWEEVDVQAARSPGGENYGWRLMEGSHCFDPTVNCNSGKLILPVLGYSHALGCSITGGYRYRGSQIPALYGMYLYGDYCSGRIWAATEVASGSWSATSLLHTNFAISTFGEDDAGELYVSRYDGANGAIYRIITASAAAVTAP